MKKYYSFLIVFLLLFCGCKSSMLVDPSTTIKYSIAKRSHVKLTVENSYNTIVATLVDDDLNSGYYSANMNMNDLPEGIYFYSIECREFDTGNVFKQVNHMLLLR